MADVTPCTACCCHPRTTLTRYQVTAQVCLTAVRVHSKEHLVVGAVSLHQLGISPLS